MPKPLKLKVGNVQLAKIFQKKDTEKTTEQTTLRPRLLKKEDIAKEKETAATATPVKTVTSFQDFKQVREQRKVSPPKPAERWRRRVGKKSSTSRAPETPTTLSLKIPIGIKQLAAALKVKASQLLGKLAEQGEKFTVDDLLTDQTIVQLIGDAHGCQIEIDSEESELLPLPVELFNTPTEQLQTRSPVVAFMGHVDHGKTTLIDAIRHTNLASKEIGSITQHLRSFSLQDPPLTIIDTPGHEAFTAMRQRGAKVTDIIILVIAGDEGIRSQTLEAIRHAQKAKVAIIVAITKSDLASFAPEQVYRQLAEQGLNPEGWGGDTQVIPCSAHSGQGLQELLDGITLQGELLELKANPNTRPRGLVLESTLHKGLGPTATLLVQNGTLRRGDFLLFDGQWAKVKTIRNDCGETITSALPTMPVEITGLSALPTAGEEFVGVNSEREAKIQAQKRASAKRNVRLEREEESEKPTLYLFLKVDMQGSLEALKQAIQGIKSTKVDLKIIGHGIGEVVKSDVELANACDGAIVGFQVQIDNAAKGLIKQTKLVVTLHEIIYHAVEKVTQLMVEKLPMLVEEHTRGKAKVLAIFRSSAFGKIAGCRVLEGTLHRNWRLRLIRQEEIVWEGKMVSLKQEKEDITEVSKGQECGVILAGCSDIEIGDTLDAHEVCQTPQEL